MLSKGYFGRFLNRLEKLLEAERHLKRRQVQPQLNSAINASPLDDGLPVRRCDLGAESFQLPVNYSTPMSPPGTDQFYRRICRFIETGASRRFLNRLHLLPVKDCSDNTVSTLNAFNKLMKARVIISLKIWFVLAC